MYKIEILSSADKNLRRINSKDREKIALGINKLSNNPRPQASKKLKGSDYYRLRIGDYRVIYLIKEKQLIVIIVRIGHRREIYRQ